MPAKLSLVETLQEIIRHCQRNEEHLHELKRRTRHQRKKAERLLQDQRRKPVQFFVPFDRPPTKVRFHLPEKEQRMSSCNHRCHLPAYEEPPIPWVIIKQTTERKYEQSSEDKERIQRNLLAEIQRRNSSRATILQLRLREQLAINC